MQRRHSFNTIDVSCRTMRRSSSLMSILNDTDAHARRILSTDRHHLPLLNLYSCTNNSSSHDETLPPIEGNVQQSFASIVPKSKHTSTFFKWTRDQHERSTATSSLQTQSEQATDRSHICDSSNINRHVSNVRTRLVVFPINSIPICSF
jgi:hypothetical protein